MSSLPRTRRYAGSVLLLSALIFASLMMLTFWTAGAHSYWTKLVTLPDIVGTYNRDGAMTIYGTLTSDAAISGVAPQTVERSNYFTVTGENFGSLQGASGSLLVDNLAAIVVKWTNTEIVGYVPEGARLGSMPVQVLTAAGASNTVNLNVTNRQPQGRIRWRAKVYGDYIPFRAGVAPPGSSDAGSIYANTAEGLTYAWSANGALKWVVRTGLVGGEGPVTVGQDGSIYVGSLLPVGNGTNAPAIIALNPNSTQKWQYLAQDSQSVRAGPNVGPDGKIYVIFRPETTAAPNLVALAPADGHLVWNYNDNYYKYGQIGKELFFGAQAGLVYFQFESRTFPQGGFYAHRLDNGQRVAAIDNGARDGLVVVAPDQSVHTALQSYSPTLSTLNWTFPLFNQGPTSAPEIGPDNVHYVDQNTYRLYAINPNGAEKWHYDDTNPGYNFGLLQDPIASPSNNLVLMGGRITFGLPGFFNAVNTQNGQRLWKFYLPDEPGFAEYGQVVPLNRPIFAMDGNTAYASADVAGDGNALNKYCFFYAINTSADSVPVNQPPVATITNPLPNSNVAVNVPVNVAVSVQDDGAIDRVEFFAIHNGFTTAIGTDTTPDANNRYSATFTPSDTGPYGINAVAYDAGGLRGDATPVTIVVNNEPPHINWVSPPDASTFQAPPSVTLTAHATDINGTITQVDFNSDRVGLLGTDTTADQSGNYSIVWNNPPVGTHQLYTWATDNNGYRSNAIITVTVTPVPTPTPTPSPTPTPNLSPTVTITSPANDSGYAPGTSVDITAVAQDSDGSIVRVEFYHDSPALSLGTDFTAPYNATASSGQPDAWNVYAVATDNSGNTTTSAPIRIRWEELNGNLSISGRIRHQQSTPGHEVFLRNAHVQLLLHNTLIRTALTDAGGNYLFSNLSFGGEYTVKPLEPGYDFFPPAVTFSGLSRDETWDFIAAGPLPDPTPTPTPGASALAWERFYDGLQHQADFDPHVAVDLQGNTYVTATSGSATDGDTDITTIKYSPTGDQLWAATFAGPGNYKDWASDIKVDSQGNSYVTGVVWGGSVSEYNVVTLKYDSSGNLAWSRFYNGPIGHWDFGEALELVTDGEGNVTGVVVAGYSQSSKSNGALFDEFVTIRYDAAGNEQWARRRSTAQTGDHANDIAVDSGGNVYVTGFAWTAVGGNETKDIVTVKYSAAGAELWAARFSGGEGTPGPLPLPGNPGADEPGNIALDLSGNVYVAGTNHAGATGPDFLLLKYNPQTGALVWSRNWAGPSSDFMASMAIDASGNVYLTGESFDGDYQAATGNETTDAATVKFDGAGNLLWNRFYRGFPGMWDSGRSIVIDAAGNAYVGGYSEGFANTDSIVIKYQPDGTESWVFRYDNPDHSDDSLKDLALDETGNLYLAGQASIVNTSGEQTEDLVTVKLAPSTAAINSPPEVDLTRVGPTIAGRPEPLDNPPTGPTIAGRSLVLDASASDHDGSVSRVEFYDGQTLIGTVNAPPYSFRWDDVPYGQHALSAAATDNSGAIRTSKTTLVTTTEAQPFNITGRVTGQSGAGVSKVTMQLASGSQSATVMTDATGKYSFIGLMAGGDYTVTPTKTGDSNGINASDALLVAQHVTGLSALSSSQQLAGDASDSGTLSAYDAALIAQTAAGIPNTGMAGTWKFLPTSRAYPALGSDQLNQNYQGIMVGDVSANWPPGAAFVQRSASPTQTSGSQRTGREQSAIAIPVSLPEQIARTGAAVRVPITAGDLSGQGVFAYQFDISFNPAVMQPASSPIETAAALSSNCTVTANTMTAGHLNVAAFCLQPLAGQGVLLNLNFNATGTPGSTTLMAWQSFLFNESPSQANPINGRLTLNALKNKPADFDGDGRTDISVWQSDSGKWDIIHSANNLERLEFWGQSALGDLAVPGDYDGDGKTDIAIYRPSEGNWYILRSSDGTGMVQGWGQSNDRPVPADYDGDGMTDPAVYRPSEGTWYVRKSTGGSLVQGWGDSTDKLVPGDYDGDGRADIAVWRPVDGNWYILLSTGGFKQQQWGLSEDKPVAGDYDGDGTTDLAVYRPSEGNWHIVKSTGGAIIRNWGARDDSPVPGDYDGDGRTDIAVWRPSQGTWYIIQSSTNTGRQAYLGSSADILVPAAYLPQ